MADNTFNEFLIKSRKPFQALWRVSNSTSKLNYFGKKHIGSNIFQNGHGGHNGIGIHVRHGGKGGQDGLG